MNGRRTIRFAAFLGFLMITAPAIVPAQLQHLLPEAYENQGRNYVLLVLATDRNEPRVFDFHLDLSMRWDAVTYREIVVVDVLPGKHNVEAVAGYFDVTGESFAVVLLDKESSVILRTTRVESLSEIFASIDRHEGDLR